MLQKRAVKGLEKPEPVKTHLRDMPILPEMVGSVIGVYNGKVYNVVEVSKRSSLNTVRLSSFALFHAS